MLECPKCKCQIEPDSWFCDQCGLELKICPQCGSYGKANRCTKCGTVLITVKEKNTGGKPESTSSSRNISNNDPASSAPLNTTTNKQTPISQKMNTTFSQRMNTTFSGRGINANQNLPLYLVSYVLGVRLPFIDGGIIGRNSGDYMSTFCTQGYVSGTHARLHLDKASGNWLITDLGSRNGTYLNGKRLAPNTPEVIWRGAQLRIATTDFIIE